MDPGSLAFWHHRSHQITCLEAKEPLLPPSVTDREAVFVHPAHLPISVTFGFYQQHALDC
jgi:hypothetical protein